MFVVFTVEPLPATTPQPINFNLNSASFSVTNTTNNLSIDSFIYSYNVSSVDTVNVTLHIEIYRSDGLYTYLFDNLNYSVPLHNNTISQDVKYIFPMSGSYSVKFYWFSPTNNILAYKEYTTGNILINNNSNASGYNSTYTYSWNYHLVRNEFIFTVDYYFTAQYNFTLHYDFVLYRLNPNNSISTAGSLSSTKSMTGVGNSKQELTFQAFINEPGSYRAIFTWKNFALNSTTSNQPSIITNFNTSLDSYHFNQQFGHNGYYYQNRDHFSFFPFILSFILGLGIFGFVIYAVYSKEESTTKSQTTKTPNTKNPLINQTNSNHKKVASFCSNCGSKIIANGTYCPNCGTKFD